MKTKAKKPTRKRVVKKVAKAPASAPSSNKVVVHVHPQFADFFRNGEETASDRMLNGHRNSAAHAALAEKLLELSDLGFEVTLRHFDAQGNEIPSP
jgi:hypothetical protein